MSDALGVALEHLEREHRRDLPPVKTVEDGRLQPVRVRVVVLLADEDQVGLRETGEHHLEIYERARGGVVDALGNVESDRGMGRGLLRGDEGEE